MLEYHAFIAGLARNCSINVRRSLNKLVEVSSSFLSRHFVVITNDNADDTDQVLREWCNEVPESTLLSLDGIANAFPDRLERLAFARNNYLIELRRRLSEGRQFDLLLVADLDGPNENLISGPSFEEAIAAAPSGWGGLFPNQMTAYYDIWALRHKKWCPNDCWAEVDRATTFPLRNAKRRAAVRKFLRNRQVHIPTAEEPILVDSAFGGLGIYRTSFISGAWYAPSTEGASHNWYGAPTGGSRHTCEHVYFNTICRRNGAFLYILPSLLNSAPPEHCDVASGSLKRPWA